MQGNILKVIGASAVIASFIGNYFVTQYKVDTLIENVSNGQKILSILVVDVEVIKAKLEDKE